MLLSNPTNDREAIGHSIELREAENKDEKETIYGSRLEVGSKGREA